MTLSLATSLTRYPPLSIRNNSISARSDHAGSPNIPLDYALTVRAKSWQKKGDDNAINPVASPPGPRRPMILMQVISDGPVKITKTTIDAAWRRRKDEQRLIIRDKDCRGLALVVNPTRMTWTYSYRLRGVNPASSTRWPNRTVTLGNPATHSPDDARTAANKIKGQAASGADPATEMKAQAEAVRRRRGTTLERLAEDYALVLARRPKMRGGAGRPTAAYVAAEIVQVKMAINAMSASDMPAVELDPNGYPQARRSRPRRCQYGTPVSAPFPASWIGV